MESCSLYFCVYLASCMQIMFFEVVNCFWFSLLTSIKNFQSRMCTSLSKLCWDMILVSDLEVTRMVGHILKKNVISQGNCFRWNHDIVSMNREVILLWQEKRGCFYHQEYLDSPTQITTPDLHIQLIPYLILKKQTLQGCIFCLFCISATLIIRCWAWFLVQSVLQLWDIRISIKFAIEAEFLLQSKAAILLQDPYK